MSGADLADDAARTPRHLERRTAREGQEQDALRIRALGDEMRDAVRERIGLAGAGAGDDEERRRAMTRRRALRGVQFFELVRHLHAADYTVYPSSSRNRLRFAFSHERPGTTAHAIERGAARRPSRHREGEPARAAGRLARADAAPG